MTYEDKMDFLGLFALVQSDIYHTAKTHGWYDNGDPNEGERIALMHSELSEALEAIRKDPSKHSEHIPDFTALEEELADVIIRIMDYSWHKGLCVAGAVLAKAEFNKKRPYKHGGKKF